MVSVKKFINSHYIKIVELFEKSKDQEVYEKLIALDPDREKFYKAVL